MDYQNALAGLKSHEYQPIPTHPQEENLPFVNVVDQVHQDKSSRQRKHYVTIALVTLVLTGSLSYFFQSSSSLIDPLVQNPYPVHQYNLPDSPYSFIDPARLVLETDRTVESKPGRVWGDLIHEKVPLPTNSWCMGFFLGRGNRTDEGNKVFQLPYIIEAFEFMQGIRVHPIRVQANDRAVMMIYENDNGMALGAVEQFHAHELAADKNLAIGRLSVVLQWKSPKYQISGEKRRGPTMYTPIVRGSPYISMIYSEATPRIFVQRSLNDENSIVIDNDPSGPKLVCGSKALEFSKVPVLVQRELKITFAVSDMQWLIFVSEPTEFTCSNLPLSAIAEINNIPGYVGKKQKDWQTKLPHFDLRATKPMKKGMVRIVLGNNCTTGTHHAALCDIPPGTPRQNDEYIALLRDYSDIYATGHANVDFEFPATSKEEDELQLKFDWKQNLMSRISLIQKDKFFELGNDIDDTTTGKQVLMYAIPHHQERMLSTPESPNKVLSIGCTPTLHGMACPVIGSKWSLLEHLHRVEFQAPRSPRMEMIPAIREALVKDIEFEIPNNYMKGAGDTYFSGKLLSKLARILLIADEVGFRETDNVYPRKFDIALEQLKKGIEIWISGKGLSPLLYDRAWGGLVSCGCDYDGENEACHNSFPNCPALTDMGSSFGAGFYNDHHFHYGYHIYAAAVAAKYDWDWGKKHFQRVLLLVRDIANPSPQDPHFTVFRHKDWYLGFSWASGIVLAQGLPYPNGQNQESSSEAISAYEAVALYGKQMALIYQYAQTPEDAANFKIAQRISDMGRLLCATETRSAKTYWHVQARGEGVARIYPDVYTPKVVGMVWSLLAQEQTWFGNEAYKSYGIQLMPLTAISELRDTPDWVAEMIPLFLESCDNNEGKYGCTNMGWRILVFTCQATIGDWVNAWGNVNKLNDDVYDSAGGNGHSKTNTLWYIATRGVVEGSGYDFSYVWDSNTTAKDDTPAISVPP